MIGSGLKKLANENGMKVAKGVGYGSLGGFAATLSEGSGYKRIVFATRFADNQMANVFLQQVNQVDIKRKFRVQTLNVAPRYIDIVFLDNPGTMKKIREFLEWFLPLLHQNGANRATICAECGYEVTGGRWVLVDGIAYYMHTTCADKAKQEILADNAQQAEETAGSYASGALGAFGGAAIGAVLWAVVLNLGYVASLVGLVIGLLAEKGYNLLKGKQGKAKILILILAIVFGVLVGTLGADTFTLIGMMNNGELPGFTYGDIPWFILAMLTESPEYKSAMISNLLMGILFAGLGVFALLRQAGKAVSGIKFIDLE